MTDKKHDKKSTGTEERIVSIDTFEGIKKKPIRKLTDAIMLDDSDSDDSFSRSPQSTSFSSNFDSFTEFHSSFEKSNLPKRKSRRKSEFAEIEIQPKKEEKTKPEYSTLRLPKFESPFEPNTKESPNSKPIMDRIWELFFQRSHSIVYFGATPELHGGTCFGRVFTKESTVRNILFKLIFNRFMDYFILLCSIATVVITVMEPVAYDMEKYKRRGTAFILFDIILLAILSLYHILKMIILLPRYYYKHDFPWTMLDWFIIGGGWITYFYGSSYMMKFYIARFFCKGLRPLIILKYTYGARIISQTLKHAFKQMLNVLALYIFLLFVYGVISTQAYFGSLARNCVVTDTNEPSVPLRFCKMRNDTGFQCPAETQTCRLVGNEESQYAHFDNIGNALLTLFQVTTLEGWTEIMYNISDSENDLLSKLFFLCIVITLPFFVLKLFLGVISASFEDVSEHNTVVHATMMKKSSLNLYKIFFNEGVVSKEPDEEELQKRKTWKGLWIDTMWFEGEVAFKKPVAFLNFLFLLFYSTFAGGFIGLQLFGGSFGDTRATFDNLSESFLTSFQLITGEDWTDILYSAYNARDGQRIISPIFFISFFLITNHIILNLFDALIISNFEQDEEERRKMKEANKDEEGDRKIQDEQNIIDKLVDKIIYLGKRLGLFAQEQNVHKPEPPPAKQEKKETKKGTQVQLDDIKIKEKGSEKVSQTTSDCTMASQKPTFRDRLRNYSLLIFSPDHPFRKDVTQIVNSNVFEWTLTIAIILSTIFMIIDNPFLRDPYPNLCSVLDWIFVIIFTIEFVFKIISRGFIFTTTAYILDFFDCFDFMALICNYISVIMSTFSVLSIFRAGRVLRPFRLMTKLKSFKKLSFAIASSYSSVIKLVLVWIVYWIVWSTIAVTLFGGLLYSCNDPSVKHKRECVGVFKSEMGIVTPRVWANPKYGNFDNIFSAALTLIKISSLEGWLVILDGTMSIRGHNLQPEAGASPQNAIFFIVFISLTAFFLLELTVGVIIGKTREASGVSSESQRKWENIKLLMQQKKPPTSVTPTENRVSVFVFNACGGFDRANKKAAPFRWFIFIVLLLDFVRFCTFHRDQAYGWTVYQYITATIFSLIYWIEVVIKMIGYGPILYFKSKRNPYDFLMALGSTFEVGVLTYSIAAGNPRREFMFIVRTIVVARTFRLLEFVRFSTITRVLFKCIPHMINIIIFTALFFIVYAVFGVDMCGKTRFGATLNDRVNFRNAFNAMVALARVVTGENWQDLMDDCWIKYPYCDPDGFIDSCGSYWSPLYFISFRLIISNFILGYLMAMILDNFDFVTSSDTNEMADAILHRFNAVWKKFDKYNTKHIPIHHLHNFLCELGPPLGVSKKKYFELSKEEIKEINRIKYELKPYVTVIPYRRRKVNLEFIKTKWGMMGLGDYYLYDEEQDTPVISYEILMNYLCIRYMENKYPDALEDDEIETRKKQKEDATKRLSIAKIVSVYLMSKYWRRFKRNQRRRKRTLKKEEVYVYRSTPFYYDYRFESYFWGESPFKGKAKVLEEIHKVWNGQIHKKSVLYKIKSVSKEFNEMMDFTKE